MTPVVTNPPASGEVPTGAFTIRWTDDEPRSQYYISIGSTYGGTQLLDVTLPGNGGAVPYEGSYSVTGLPRGAVAYLDFWYFDTTWHDFKFAFYVRAAEGDAPPPGEMPDITLEPASGTPFAAGSELTVTWTGLPTGATGTLFAGTQPGSSDIAAVAATVDDSTVLPTSELTGGRVYVAFFVTVGAESWQYAASYPVAVDDVAVETVVRRLTGTLWLESWLGPALDERRLCPARVLGFEGEEIDFAVEDPDDVAPWTPAEVRAGVGYALLRLREIDRFDTGITGSSEVVDGEMRFTSQEYRLYALEFELAVPSKLRGADPVAALEDRAAVIENLFRGLSLTPTSSSVLSIRNLTRYPTRRRPGGDDGTWRRVYVTVTVRARVQEVHAAAQEVALP